MTRLSFRLYAITDRTLCAPTPLPEVIRRLLDAGVRGIQLREKDLDDRELAKLAAETAALCSSCGAQLFVNSRIEIALDAGASGVHLPAHGPSAAEAIEKGRGRLIVGCSAHSLAEAKECEVAGADFVAFSPVYSTASKPGYGPAAGPKRLREVAREVAIPVLALAGITPERVAECLRAGAHGVAVMSGLMWPDGVEARAARYLSRIEAVLGTLDG
ncbi:MAG: thiamine phosphate synthase [bacterium]